MADADIRSTSQWIQFFRNAGLPPNVAANYALIFSENRIQRNMLMDLSKEYLYDMGIKVMGDVIAILRYSKEFHNQLAKEKIIGNSASQTLPTNKNAHAIRLLGHYTRPVSNSPKRLLETPVAQNNFKAIPQKRALSARMESPYGGISPVAKKPRPILSEEEEGTYKVKMPVGNTERTRKILESAAALSSKKSVFDRLGDSDVSSSTDIKRTLNSVFNRLGPSSTEIATSTTESQLAYRGVLKLQKPKTVITTVGKSRFSKKTINLSSARRTISSPAILKNRRTVVDGNSGVVQINSILQQNAQLNTVNKKPVLSKIRVVKPPRKSVLNRLGSPKVKVGNAALRSTFLQKQRQSNSQKSVFQRLGK